MKQAILVGLCFIYTCVNAQETVSMESVQAELMKAKGYTLAFFIKGSKEAAQDQAIAQQNQMEHLQYLFTLKSQDHLLLFGPVTDNSHIRGIMIFKTTDSNEVKKLLDEDPHVKAGRLAYEIHPWFGLPGQALK